ncbi:hypothetical protein IWW50_004074 [Coemansia erecta]|nr:hypothetical protein GGF43_003433 [Coemansia sp. RSA 2618]KAJ2822764.1 hypothetical protein IWW50_004074 [Coemansia erecta]
MTVLTLSGKTALVAGASGGIGGAISRELARRGAQLVLTGRNRARLDALQASLAHADTHTVTPCDLQSPASIRELVKTTGPRIDILVNAAGVSRDSLAMRQRDADLDEMLQTNLLGAMTLCRLVGAQMVRQRSGCIVNVSSIIGVHGNVGQSAYAATKAGLIGFTKSLAKELGPRGVRANIVAPGFIDTEMTQGVAGQSVTKGLIDNIPLRAIGSVEDVAHGAAFLAEAQYITGHVLVIDGGLFV